MFVIFFIQHAYAWKCQSADNIEKEKKLCELYQSAVTFGKEQKNQQKVMGVRAEL